jgi:hypothetical protein
VPRRVSVHRSDNGSGCCADLRHLCASLAVSSRNPATKTRRLWRRQAVTPQKIRT